MAPEPALIAPGLRLDLTGDESTALRGLAGELAAAHPDPRDHELYREAPLWAQKLPPRLRAELTAVRRREEVAYVHVTGLPVDDDALGATPARWDDRAARARSRGHETELVLLGSLLGEVFGWDSQQDGAVVHDIIPIREFENAQINFASREPIWWHTEDAFHPYHPDYLALMCLRNREAAATTVSCVADWDLSGPEFDVLFESRFRHRPDISHALDGSALPRHPLLSGDRARPRVRVDPYFLEPQTDRAVTAALDEFRARVEASLRAVVLRPGEVLLLDNHRAVHGRRPFTASYDGRDRWLKRISVSRDLRNCPAARSSRSPQLLRGEQQ